MFRLSLVLLTLSAAPALADVWTFNTPSGNIECSVGEGFDGSDIICSIFKRSGPSSVPQMAGCPVSRGIKVEMLDRGYVSMSCLGAGERGYGGQSVAEYGVTGQFGGITCQSSTKGLDCRNQDGHGFFLSRAVQNAW
ncbi:DUF6636 domain-containing protein [Sulfitobacter sp. M368]|uniref:DUF6636 domain-containing protein n=1 Tax=Sulfitobacter sp. M368 TaxID=2867021 RepID=UPI0021A8E75F|nr:DUF6636 domain-containing protein [Sulfitobacter sp. M368]UWR15963.1 hypothetical protein K3754_03410 [Sulfitobacter sp. M368]